MRGASCEKGKATQLNMVDVMKMIKIRMVKYRWSFELKGARGRTIKIESNDTMAYTASNICGLVAL